MNNFDSEPDKPNGPPVLPRVFHLEEGFQLDNFPPWGLWSLYQRRMMSLAVHRIIIPFKIPLHVNKLEKIHHFAGYSVCTTHNWHQDTMWLLQLFMHFIVSVFLMNLYLAPRHHAIVYESMSPFLPYECNAI